MESQLFQILHFIAQKEFQLQNIRQLLCEEVTFNPLDTFNYLLSDANQRKITINSIQAFLGKGHNNNKALQNVLKFYGNNNLNIEYSQFELIIVSREDRLLAKLVRERQEVGMEFPQFIINYLKKLWTIQEEIHLFVINVRKNSKRELGIFLKFNKNQLLDQVLLKNQFVKAAQKVNQNQLNFCPRISVELVLRYLKRNKKSCQLSFYQLLLQIFFPQNCKEVKRFLKEKEQNFNNQISKKKLQVDNPLVHKQYKKLKSYKQKCKQTVPYCYRQRMSVESHISRNKKLPDSRTVKTKIKQFSSFTQKKMLIFFKCLKKIIKIAVQINRIKMEVNLESSTLLELFQEITKNDQLIPSELKNYLEKSGIFVQLSQCFALFRRYATALTGKLSRKQFVRIFGNNIPLINTPTKNATTLTLQNRKYYLSILLKQISLEHQIQKQKLVFEAKRIDLRDVFSLIDATQKGKISVTDLEVCYCQIIQEKLNNSDLLILWRRMGKKEMNQYLEYDLFMMEMLPRMVQKLPKNTHL